MRKNNIIYCCLFAYITIATQKTEIPNQIDRQTEQERQAQNKKKEKFDTNLAIFTLEPKPDGKSHQSSIKSLNLDQPRLNLQPPQPRKNRK